MARFSVISAENCGFQPDTTAIFSYCVDIMSQNSPSESQTPGSSEIYLDHVKLKNSERTLHEYKRLLEVDFIPHLGRMKMVDIKRKQVIALLDEKAKTAGIQANRNLAVIRAMFNFCVDRDILDATPLVQMKKLVKDVPRERTLNRHELVWFLRELTAPYLNENTRFALLLSLMLAQRSEPPRVSRRLQLLRR